MISAEKSNYLQDIHFDNPEEFLQGISPNGNLYHLLSNDYLFRGHARDDYKLLPSILRDCHYDLLAQGIPCDKMSYMNVALNEKIRYLLEYRMLKNYYNRCNNQGLWVPEVKRFQLHALDEYDILELMHKGTKWLPTDLLEIAALAQHYGLPTRLLDWTSDMYVALFFAADGGYKDSQKPMFSSSLEQTDAIRRALKEKEIPTKKDRNIEIWALNNKAVYAYNKYPIPLKLIQPKYYGNKNIQAQKGILTLWQVNIPPSSNETNDFLMIEKTPLDKLVLNFILNCPINFTYPVFYRITLPQSSSLFLLEHLRKLGYSEAKIFPGHRSVANEIINSIRFQYD